MLEFGKISHMSIAACPLGTAGSARTTHRTNGEIEDGLVSRRFFSCDSRGRACERSLLLEPQTFLPVSI